jgi:hypothetical protein
MLLCGFSLPKRVIERLEHDDLADWRTRIGAAPHRFTISGGGREWARMSRRAAALARVVPCERLSSADRDARFQR